MNYTKGEWKVERPYVDKGFMISVRDKRGLLKDWVAEVQPTKSGEANANLIAAAPSMYEALKAIIIDLKVMKNYDQRFVAKWEAIVAKAEGK